MEETTKEDEVTMEGVETEGLYTWITPQVASGPDLTVKLSSCSEREQH